VKRGGPTLRRALPISSMLHAEMTSEALQELMVRPISTVSKGLNDVVAIDDVDDEEVLDDSDANDATCLLMLSLQIMW